MGGLFYSRRAIDDPQYIYDAVVRLIAKIPTMVAAFQLIRKGQDPIQPRDDLAYSANFLYMLTEREPDPLAARIFDRCLILHANGVKRKKKKKNRKIKNIKKVKPNITKEVYNNKLKTKIK